MKKKEGEPSFEEAMKKLEGIVEKLEKGNIPLEEALKEFDQGVQLVRYLNKKLDDAERKIELLMKDKNGRITKKSLRFEEGELIEEQKIENEEEDDEEPGESTPSLF